jgi:hypothetical protein
MLHRDKEIPKGRGHDVIVLMIAIIQWVHFQFQLTLTVSLR